MLVGRVGLGEEAAGEDDSGHLLLEQQFDVVGLGDAALGLRAQDGVSPCCASAPPITSAKAGKIGFWSSGRTRPTSLARSPRSCVGRSYPSTSSAVSTDCRVAWETPGLPLSTRLTVASLTPTFFAT